MVLHPCPPQSLETNWPQTTSFIPDPVHHFHHDIEKQHFVFFDSTGSSCLWIQFFFSHVFLCTYFCNTWWEFGALYDYLCTQQLRLYKYLKDIISWPSIRRCDNHHCQADM